MKALYPAVITGLVAWAATTACGRGQGSGAAPATPASASPSHSLPDPLPDVAARVNGEPVPMRNVRVVAELSLHNHSYPPERRAEAYHDALDRFISRELLLQEAVAQGLNADQKRLEAAEDKIHAAYPDDKDWLAFLGQQGFNPQSFKTELRAQYTVNALLERRAWVSERQISDEDVAERYRARAAEYTVAERYKVRQIALLFPPDFDAARKGEFRTKAEKILVEARTGGDFAKLAQKYSEDKETASQGGLLPPFGKGELDPTLTALEKAPRNAREHPKRGPLG
jgi:parvulin-like peptidyl-prolyl isomerase